MIVVAFNFRPAVASLGPEIDHLRSALGIDAGSASVLTAIPVLCFGVFAVAGPWLAQRLGVQRTLLAVMAVILVGLLVRVGPDAATLFAGTFIAAAGIAVGNVVLPVLIKRDFPERTGLMMGLYTTAVAGSAAAAAGLTVPIGDALGGGWRPGLGVWAVVAALGLVLWLPHARDPVVATVAPRHWLAQLGRDRLAWMVTLFFGLQSLNFYAVLSWLPSIYEDHGYSATAAGGLLSLSTVVQLPIALTLPAVATRMRRQHLLVIGAAGMTAVGFGGILLAPVAAAPLWAVILGIGQGAAFPLALTFLVLRAGSADATAQLSTMAQSVGYVIAAIGPLLVGALHAATGRWHASLVLLLVLLAPELYAGLRSAAPRYIRSDVRTATGSQPPLSPGRRPG